MPVTPVTPGARARLAEHMEARRQELDLTWNEVAVRGGISVKSLQVARTGKGGIRDDTKRGIDKGLAWAPGGVDLILGGGDPVPLAVPAAQAPAGRRLPVPHQDAGESALAPFLAAVQAALIGAITRSGSTDPPGAEIPGLSDWERGWWDRQREDFPPGGPLLSPGERVRHIARLRLEDEEGRRAGLPGTSGP